MKLLCHNAYWFQGHPSRWGAERVADVPEVLDALTMLYASEGCDVVCLQEVQRSELAGTLARDLAMPTCFHAPGGMRPDYGGAVLSRLRARCRDCARMDGHSPHERTHLRASIEWQGELLEVAVIHLPSNRYAESPEAGTAARVDELKRILTESPRPNVIVGDMNCRPDSAPYRLVQDAGFADASAGSHGVDYVWLDATCARRLTRFAVLDSGAFCRTTPEGAVWRLSDHAPLIIELR